MDEKSSVIAAPKTEGKGPKDLLLRALSPPVLIFGPTQQTDQRGPFNSPLKVIQNKKATGHKPAGPSNSDSPDALIGGAVSTEIETPPLPSFGTGSSSQKTGAGVGAGIVCSRENNLGQSPPLARTSHPKGVVDMSASGVLDGSFLLVNQSPDSRTPSNYKDDSPEAATS